MKVSFEIPKEKEDVFKQILKDHNALKGVRRVIKIIVCTQNYYVGDLNINIKDFVVEE